jgi:hypothetical protein
MSRLWPQIVAGAFKSMMDQQSWVPGAYADITSAVDPSVQSETTLRPDELVPLT